MAEFKQNAPEIYKEKHVSFTGNNGTTSYNHATLGAICEIIVASLARFGFSHRWDTKQPDSGMIVVSCIITHSLGHSETTEMQAPPDNSGKKNGIQQIASTVTYCQRYTLLSACGLSTKDMPDDDGHGATIPPEEKPIIKTGLTGKAFDRAVASVADGSYTVAEIFKFYDLTDDQRIAIDDASKGKK